MNSQLVQANLAISKYALDDPALSGFVNNLDRINALADESRGFIWRHVSDDEDAEAKRVFGNEALIFNMSVWETLDDLRNFVYQSGHVNILRKRSQWFVPQDVPAMALWWQASAELPTVADAKRRLDYLGQHGPTPQAFTFRTAFDRPPSDTAVD